MLLKVLYMLDSLANQLCVLAFQCTWDKSAFLTTAVTSCWFVCFSHGQRDFLIQLLSSQSFCKSQLVYFTSLFYDHLYFKPGWWSELLDLINFLGQRKTVFLMCVLFSKNWESILDFFFFNLNFTVVICWS